MIGQDVFPVYAQYNEDIILAALLADVKAGFYVDVGANHETYHSVTRYFYDRGWSGINIEPIPRLLEEIAKRRTRDTNLQLAISAQPGEMNFREYPEHDGLSTLSSESKTEPDKMAIPFTDYKITVMPLHTVFAEQKVRKIDFLKIDVEGHEFEVLKSNDWYKYRPTVVAIEANHRATDWSDYLRDHKYERVIFDGLNEYYLDGSKISKFDGYAERAAILAHSAIRSHHLDQWHADLKRMEELDDMTKRQDALIKQLEEDLAQAQQVIARLDRYSLLDKALTSRLKIAVKGLTVDYVRAKLTK
jgi:FkbM family methyltransferase